MAFCEIEPFPRKVLAKHWPNVPCFEDVRKLMRQDIDGPIDLICGGYPCQPFSTAGQRLGKEDDRHLWPEVNRLLDEFRPTWFIGENVAGHISMGLDDVLSDLENKGYTARTFVIPACAVDAKHRRDRVWIVANSGIGRCGEPGEWKGEQPWRTKTKRPGKVMANPNSNDRHGRGSALQMGRLRLSGKTQDNDFRKGTEWRPEPAVGIPFDGISEKLDAIGGLKNADAAKKRACEILSDLPAGIVEEAFQRAAGRLRGVSETQVLLAWLCRVQTGQASEQLAAICEEAAQEIVRSVWHTIEIASAPLRPRCDEQFAREYSDALHQLSRNTPSQFPAAWSGGFWEDDIPRVATSVKDRTGRLKALGNAVVPQIPEMLGYAILDAIASNN